MLEIKDLRVNYGGIAAVQGASLKIERGSIVTLIGANGAGKSSIIRSVAGLNTHVQGDILYSRKKGDAPESIRGLRPENMVRRGISLSPEGRRILPHLTVEENLMLGAYTRSDKAEIAKDKELVYQLFPRLKERSWQKGGTLSGGEQQMLAVGRALMIRPNLIMLDEPSLGLAPLLVREIFSIIKRIHESGVTVLLVEQNAYAALNVADYAYILEVGKITLEGTGKELLSNPQVRAAYLGG
ncbi:MAG: ABC transporter ATP-binding protein [Desulfovibrionaceae bacterium]|nr:ABC transporter ATP-binding protein [Desulfovibrionaceae bacterium]